MESAPALGAATPCAWCAQLRQPCVPGCVFAPYFPPGDAVNFAVVDTIFGARNVATVVAELNPEQRKACVQKVVDEAFARQTFGGGSIPHATVLFYVLDQAKAKSQEAAAVDFKEHAGNPTKLLAASKRSRAWANPPCARCSHLRQECAPGCAFAPYFPAHDADGFSAADAVFGTTNIARMLAAYKQMGRVLDVAAFVDLAKACQYDASFGRDSFHQFLYDFVERDIGGVAAAGAKFEDYIGDVAVEQAARAVSMQQAARVEQAARAVSMQQAARVQQAGVDQLAGVSILELPDDAMVQILIRIPPTDLRSLIRAAVVCKPWREIIASIAFLRRYRAFHCKPVLLGFVQEEGNISKAPVTKFVPTIAFRPDVLECRDCRVLDCRHGRVLLQQLQSGEFMVWNPVTGEQHLVPEPTVSIGVPSTENFNAVIFCAAGAGCDHHSCSNGPFRVAYSCIQKLDSHAMVHGSVYSSVTAEWRPGNYQKDSLSAAGRNSLLREPGSVVGFDAYYLLGDCCLLKYDMEERTMWSMSYKSMITKHEQLHCLDNVVIMETKNSTLGLAMLFGHRLRLWSMETRPNGVTEWVQTRIMTLEFPYPITAPSVLGGYADVSRSIFVCSRNGSVFSINTETLEVEMVCRLGIRVSQFKFPLYLCF